MKDNQKYWLTASLLQWVRICWNDVLFDINHSKEAALYNPLLRRTLNGKPVLCRKWYYLVLHPNKAIKVGDLVLQDLIS